MTKCAYLQNIDVKNVVQDSNIVKIKYIYVMYSVIMDCRMSTLQEINDLFEITSRPVHPLTHRLLCQ